MMGGDNVTFLSTKLVLHEVKSQASRVSERKGQIKNKPHCTGEALPPAVLENGQLCML